MNSAGLTGSPLPEAAREGGIERAEEARGWFINPQTYAERG
jgi:hypothetical protein